MEQEKINIKPLNGNNDWPIWKYRIKFVLNYHEDTLEIFEGKFQKPEEPGFNADETLQKVIRFGSARDAWLELYKIFEDSSDNQLYNICLQFFKFSWENDDMAAHLSKRKNLWNDLNGLLEGKRENVLPEMLLICKIMDTLPASYRSFKSSWLLKETIKGLYSTR